MTKSKGSKEYRQGWVCPLCPHLASRKIDLKKHLMAMHELTRDEALVKQREGRFAYEELTSVRHYPPMDDRYTKNRSGGEQ